VRMTHIVGIDKSAGVRQQSFLINRDRRPGAVNLRETFPGMRAMCNFEQPRYGIFCSI